MMVGDKSIMDHDLKVKTFHSVNTSALLLVGTWQPKKKRFSYLSLQSLLPTNASMSVWPHVLDIILLLFLESYWRTINDMLLCNNHIFLFFLYTLNKLLCVILGGLVVEHIVFGYSEKALYGDVDKVMLNLSVY